MRRDYTLTPLIIPILIFAFGLLLFGTLDATQIDAPDCLRERNIQSECLQRGERLICPTPNPTLPCTLGTTISRENNSKLNENATQRTSVAKRIINDTATSKGVSIL